MIEIKESGNIEVAEYFAIREIVVLGSKIIESNETIIAIKIDSENYIIKPLFSKPKILKAKDFNKLSNIHFCQYDSSNKNCIVNFARKNLINEDMQQALLKNEVHYIDVKRAYHKVVIHKDDKDYNDFYNDFYNNCEDLTEKQQTYLEAFNFRVNMFRESFI